MGRQNPCQASDQRLSISGQQLLYLKMAFDSVGTFCSISNNVQHLFAFWRLRQILIAVLGDQYVIFYSDSSNMHIPFQYLFVNPSRDFWVG